MISKVKEMVAEIAAHDPASWGSHWVICVGLSIVVAVVFGRVGGFVASEVLLVYFALREGLNYGSAHAVGKADRKKLKDGLLDFAGPLANHLVWWYAVLA